MVHEEGEAEIIHKGDCFGIPANLAKTMTVAAFVSTLAEGQLVSYNNDLEASLLEMVSNQNAYSIQVKLIDKKLEFTVSSFFNKPSYAF